MTNFEKWRDSLTPEGARIIVGCDFCPNRKCPFKDDYSGDDKCSSSYLAWANAPAKEEE